MFSYLVVSSALLTSLISPPTPLQLTQLASNYSFEPLVDIIPSSWNEWLTFPIKFADLPREAVLGFSIWDSVGPGQVAQVGSTAVSIFGKYGALRSGMYDLKLWPPSPSGQDEELSFANVWSRMGKSAKSDQLTRLNKLKKKYHSGQMVKVDWLDRVTFSTVEKMTKEEKNNSRNLYLSVEFPQVLIDNIAHSVVYYERRADEDCARPFESINATGSNQAACFHIFDPEIGLENLLERKHHKLSRPTRPLASDRELKPSPETRNKLNEILAYPPTRPLSAEDQDLVWKYRAYLTNQKKALSKFLKCVKWDMAEEVSVAIRLLETWAPMDSGDALELLSAQFTHPAVRRYAVRRLQDAPDDDLLLYLLQLVQALKYEDINKILSDGEILKRSAPTVPSQHYRQRSSTVASRDDEIASARNGSISTQVSDMANSDMIGPSDATQAIDMEMDIDRERQMDLATFLIERAARSGTLANYFYWYLVVECEEAQAVDAAHGHNTTAALAAANSSLAQNSTGLVASNALAVCKDSRILEMYRTVLARFSERLRVESPLTKTRRTVLKRQQEFVDRLVGVMKAVAREPGNRVRKIEKLQTLLQNGGIDSSASSNSSSATRFNFTALEDLPLVLDPHIRLRAILPERATLFKSALMPARLTFLTTEGTEYVSIFKHGDDLRQDQLILQMIILMDKLLRRENLDLKLTPYRVLATSAKHGFVQYIDSTPVAEVQTKDKSITEFLRKLSPDRNSTAAANWPNGISPEIMDTYVKSTAGYCVITYLLGVGDRHLDNLLLTRSGNLFHIDFGYILGRDPKPLPPPFKLTGDMVAAMGGVGSQSYKEFRKACYTAFLHLRRHCNLILNLFSLMVDASVPDIALEPDKTVKKVQDRFRMDLDDEEAVHYFENLIDLSANAMMAQMFEFVHSKLQLWRK